ncbi:MULTISPECIES: hypothetical protein [unclassified Moraxella]|uniref:hypothetical protein n=1 Tax=unclassified Moraxella TaxID=2685852 RepID=UPI003AF6962C
MLNQAQIIDYAYHFVLEKSQVDKKRLDYYLNQFQETVNIREKSLNYIYKSLLGSCKNTGRMTNAIGNIDDLNDVLFNFDPIKVKQNFSDWEAVFHAIQQANIRHQDKFNLQNSLNSWVRYSKSIFTGATFLAEFESYKSFSDFVDCFVKDNNPNLQIALPLLLKEEIFGLGFALACDFIKENVSDKYVKPDTHINDILIGIEVCNEDDSNFTIFRKAINFANATEKSPYYIDKLFWLIGSGYFYENNQYPTRLDFQKNLKKQFINEINNLNRTNVK